MKSFLQWTIPAKHNNFHPHILRSSGLLLIALVLAFIPALYNLISAGSSQVLGYATAISTSELFSLSNDQRVAAGLKGYTLNSKLNQAALAKANHMFANNYWSHDAPDGTTPWSFIAAAGYSYSSAGENLAKNFNTSAGVVNGWMNSPAHNANVLNTDFVDVGYAAVNGTLQGEETTLVVAMYGRPQPAPAPSPAPTAVTEPTPATPSTTPSQPTPAAPSATPSTTQTTKPSTAETPTKQPTKTTGTSSISKEAEPKNSSDDDKGEVKSALSLNPVELYTGLNWGQKTSLFILLVLTLLFILKHTLVWRAQRKGIKGVWLRAHPVGQLSVIAVIAVMTLLSGVGSVL